MARFEISPNIGNISKTVDALVDYVNGLDDRIEEVAANIPSKMVVEELPETGDPNITYYVGPKGTEPNLYYEVWVWVQEEEEGPFVWRELEDTDQVDLSGYLPIQNGVTSYPQVYGKDTDGTQGMVEYSSTVRNAALVQRNGSGQVAVPNTPTDNSHATSKKYVDDTFIAKETGISSRAQVYVKASDGTQARYDLSVVPAAYTVAYRDSYSCVQTGSPTQNDQAVPKGYADTTYLAKNTATSSYFQAYCKNTDGTQAMCNANVGVVGGALPLRRSNGNIAVPLEPTENGDAASKKYVDDNATGVRYIHQLTLTYATAPDEYLTVMATLVNRSSLPITAMSYDVFREMSVQYGDYGQSLGYNPVMVVKCPNSFHGHDFPDPIDGIYWKDLNNSTEGFATSATMTLSVSDYVSLF